MSAANDARLSAHEDPAPKLPEIVSRLEALLVNPHVVADYVRLRIALLRAQWPVLETLAARAGEEPAQRGGNGRSPNAAPLEPRDVPFDAKLLARLARALSAALERPGQAASFEPLLAAADDDPGLLAGLACAAGWQRQAAPRPPGREVESRLEHLAARYELTTDLLTFFGRLLAAPFVTHAVRQRRTGRPPRTPRANVGTCPDCGSPAGLACLRRDDGQRVLCCSLCGSRWRFIRLACPRCNTRDTDALTFLRTGENDPRWIETCASCRHYIKTVDLRKLPVGAPFIPLVEETATLHLDLLAENDGCAPNIPYAACG